MTIKYMDNGSLEIDIDNSELLAQRADIDINKEFKDERGGNGGISGKEEEALKGDEKRVQWHEPTHKATDVKHKCPICGTNYWGRPNKRYCGTPCKEVAKKRRQRKRKRDIRDFKPHRGKAGEVYFLYTKDNKETISFVPAFSAGNRGRAKKYLEDTYSTNIVGDCVQQVNEVIRK